MFDRIGLAANGGNQLLASHRESSTLFREANTEQSAAAKILESCGTTRVEALRQHSAPPPLFGDRRLAFGRKIFLTPLFHKVNPKSNPKHFKMA